MIAGYLEFHGVRSGKDTGPRDLNMRILHSGSKPETRGIPETLACRILFFGGHRQKRV